VSWGNEEEQPPGDERAGADSKRARPGGGVTGRGNAETAGPPGDEAVRLFDLEEINVEWSAWSPGVDYTAAVQAAKAGAAAVQRILRGIEQYGSRARVQPLCTRLGEPVVRVDLHPDGWRQIAALVTESVRYRRVRGVGQSEPPLPLFAVRAEVERVTGVGPFDRWVQLALERAESTGDFARFHRELRGWLITALSAKHQDLLLAMPYEEREEASARLAGEWIAAHPARTSLA